MTVELVILQDLEDALVYVKAPGLECLTIKRHREKQLGVELSLETIPQENFPNLRRLNLHEVIPTIFLELELLRDKFAQLEQITMVHCAVEDMALILTESFPGDVLLFPNLRQLHFHSSGINIKELELILESVSSGLRKLSSFKIERCRLEGKDVIEKFRHFVNVHPDLITFVPIE
ncbi:hypothetical protein M422DRAFT_56943 [Sphaerobolus stellatus SS14]|uniref:Uncharacterized protein n=1 Tax=Sphaerobolus stellatus (strain SS14) TaxID=990650 RepID=A0A0C9U251_SPHS4|nr:hypothetical protein M422DRAFT_56943 [Sphaerobolus stellatus SS14]